MTVLVTGATGFVGRALVHHLTRCDFKVRAVVRERRAPGFFPAGTEQLAVGQINAATVWDDALMDVSAVVHLAARTHVINESGGGDLADYRPLNVEGTRRLAESAAASGVHRLVFLSSIKVNGERTTDRAYSSKDIPAPRDAYGISKWEAEQVLAQIAHDTGLEIVVVRPPLIYGPGVKGNFQRLIRLVDSGVPMPFGSIRNARSMLALPNLVDLLVRCLQAPEAAGQTLLASDGDDLSIASLVRLIAGAMNRPARLISVPQSLLRTGGHMLGKSAEVDRLCGSLQINDEQTREILHWSAPVRVDVGIQQAVNAYLAGAVQC